MADPSHSATVNGVAHPQNTNNNNNNNSNQQDPLHSLTVSTVPFLPDLDPSTFSSVAANDIISLLIDKGTELLYDHYLAAKETDFVVARTVQSVKLLVEWQLPVLDGADHRPAESALHGFMSPVTGRSTNNNHQDQQDQQQEQQFEEQQQHQLITGAWACEPEPAPVPLDTWARSSIPTRVPFMRRTEVESRRLRSRQSATRPTSQGEEEEGASGYRHRSPTGSDSSNARSAISSVNKSVIQQMQLAPISENDSFLGDGNNTSHEGGGAAGPHSALAAKERARIVAELDAKKKKAEDTKKKEETEAKDKEARDKAFRKKLRGKSYTIDEHGGILLVHKPNPDKLPPTVLPVGSIEMGGGREEEDGGDGSSKTKKRGSAARGSGENAPTYRGLDDGHSSGMNSSASSLVISGAERSVRIDNAKRDPKFFRETSSTQPSLIDAVKTGVVGMKKPTALAAGVSIREEGRFVSNPLAASDDRHITRTDLAMKQMSLTGSTSQLTMTAGSPQRGYDELPPIFSETNYNNNNNHTMMPNSSPLQASTMDALATEFSLASIPDVVPPMHHLSSSVGGGNNSGSGGSGLPSPQPRPYPVRNYDEDDDEFRSSSGQQQKQQAYYFDKNSSTSSGKYVSAETEPPNSMPVESSRTKAAALGNLSKGPRDRLAGNAVPMPTSHLPAPMFPAISHHHPTPVAPAGTAALLGSMYASLSDTSKIPEVLKAAAIAASSITNGATGGALPGGGYAVRPSSANRPKDLEVSSPVRAGTRFMANSLSSAAGGGGGGNSLSSGSVTTNPNNATVPAWGPAAARKTEGGKINVRGAR